MSAHRVCAAVNASVATVRRSAASSAEVAGLREIRKYDRMLRDAGGVRVAAIRQSVGGADRCGEIVYDAAIVGPSFAGQTVAHLIHQAIAGRPRGRHRSGRRKVAGTNQWSKSAEDLIARFSCDDLGLGGRDAPARYIDLLGVLGYDGFGRKGEGREVGRLAAPGASAAVAGPRRLAACLRRSSAARSRAE